MQLPKSISEIRRLIGYNAGRPPADINVNRQAPPQTLVQGTRAFATQGTWSHPGSWNNEPYGEGADDEPWTPPITQYDYGDGPEVSNTQTNKTTYPWPPNRARDEINPSIGHNNQLRTDVELQVGPGPGRILRHMYERVYGTNGSANFGTPVGIPDMPWETSWLYIPHVKVPRKALGTKGPQKLSDDNLAIPAIFAGNPRQ